MPGDQIQQLGVVDDPVIVRLLSEVPLLRRPRDVFHDAFGIVVSLHEPVGRGQISGRQIGRPRLRVAPRELLLDVRKRGVGLDALADEQVDGVGSQPPVSETAGGCRREAGKPFVEIRQHLRGNCLAALLRLHQEMRSVDRRELGRLGRGRPQSQAALFIRAAAQHRERRVERPRIAALDRAELRPRGDDQRRHTLADQLFGAGVRVVVQIGRQTLAPYKGQRRNCGLDFPLLAV